MCFCYSQPKLILIYTRDSVQTHPISILCLCVTVASMESEGCRSFKETCLSATGKGWCFLSGILRSTKQKTEVVWEITRWGLKMLVLNAMPTIPEANHVQAWIQNVETTHEGNCCNSMKQKVSRYQLVSNAEKMSQMRHSGQVEDYFWIAVKISTKPQVLEI